MYNRSKELEGNRQSLGNKMCMTIVHCYGYGIKPGVHVNAYEYIHFRFVHV